MPTLANKLPILSATLEDLSLDAGENSRLLSLGISISSVHSTESLTFSLLLK